MKKIIADRFGGTGGAAAAAAAAAATSTEDHEKMDMDNEAQVLLGLRDISEQEQEQISSVGGDSSVDDRVRSNGSNGSNGGISSNMESKTTVPSLGSTMMSKTSHPLNSLSNYPTQPSVQPRPNNNFIVSGSSSLHTGKSSGGNGASNVVGGLSVRRKSSSTKSSIPNGMYAASDIVSDFIHGFDRTRFANNTKWAASFGRTVIGKGNNRLHSGSLDSGSIQSLNQQESASSSSEARKKACHEGTVSVTTGGTTDSVNEHPIRPFISTYRQDVSSSAHDSTVGMTMSIDGGVAGDAPIFISQPTVVTHPFHTQVTSHSSLSMHAMQMRCIQTQPVDPSSLSSSSSSIAGNVVHPSLFLHA